MDAGRQSIGIDPTPGVTARRPGEHGGDLSDEESAKSAEDLRSVGTGDESGGVGARQVGMRSE